MEGNVITSRRRRREASGTPGLKARLPVVARMLSTENTTLLGCGTWEDPSSAEACVEVKCNMYNILPNAQLELITFNMQFNASQAGRCQGPTQGLLHLIGQILRMGIN